jgi:uncharacterized protein YfaS (alpha-2-macroglobulin family)
MRQFLYAFTLLLTMAGFAAGGRAQAAFDSAATAAEKDLRIIRVNPSGEDVQSARQIVITFNRPVVPLGKMERDAKDLPVTITPKVDCEWRWLNTRSLACQLTEKTALKAATKYTLDIRPGIKAEDGATIEKAYHADFITQRPDISYIWFKTWKSPGFPVLRVRLNQPVTVSSLRKFLHFEDAAGAETRVDVQADPDDHTAPSIVPFGKGWLFFGRQEPRKSDDRLTKKDGEEARSVWLVTPRKELPFDAHMKLQLEKGIVSALGPETGVNARTAIAFDTYPAFNVVGVSCRDNDNNPLLFKPDEAAGGKACDPMGAIYVEFSVPVQRTQVRDNFIFTPALSTKETRDAVWGDMSYQYSQLNSPHRQGQTYRVNLPYGLKAAQDYTLTLKEPVQGLWEKAWHWMKSQVSDQPQTALEDEFGRKLMTPVTIHFKTDHRKPNFELDHHVAVLEKATDSDVPIFVNNLDKLSFDYRSVTADGDKQDRKMEQDLPKVRDVQFAVPFGVRKALDGKSGAVYGSLNTDPVVVKGYDAAYRLFAEVTPYQLHVKLGHFSTLVWVTDMAGGNPVGGARVSLYKDALTTLSTPQKTLGTAVTDENGVAMLPGTADVDPNLEIERHWDDDEEKLFVRVQKGDDLAVMPLNNSFSIDTWRASNESIYPHTRRKFGHIVTWGTTAQGIYRAGDTIQYKFYVRNQNDRTLVPAPKGGYKLDIVDPLGNVAGTVDDVALNEFGAYDGTFKIAKDAAVGWYSFRLTAKFATDENEDGDSAAAGFTPLRVLVSDFTPVPFKVVNQLNGDLFHAGQDVTVQTDAQLHSGGPYTDAGARVTAILSERAFHSENPAAKGFTFTLPDYEMHDSRQIYQKMTPLDGKGHLDSTFNLAAQDFAYGRLTVESAVQDDRGKFIAAQGTADYVGVDRFVGMNSPQWAYSAKKPVGLQYIVTDEKGVPAKGTAVAIDLEKLVTTAARIKGAGNAYLTNYTSTWKHVADCKGTSTTEAQTCGFTPDSAGSYRAIAHIKDTQGHEHAAGVEFWVTGSDYVLWNSDSDVLLPIIPEEASYHVGDTAHYLIKNPYPGAKALITVERYGVIDSFVQTLNGSTPVIDLPIKPDYLPGFYLSVVVVSPRVEKPLGEGQVDLGKPTFRMGYVTVPVKDPYKEMAVTARTDRDVYRPRDKVTVTLHAEPRMKDKKEPVELAVAVLDESVLDLVAGGASAFDPYNGFYSLDGLDLSNYSLLTRLIGRQKFEKKGANPGGDGGADLQIRDLFKFVAYWNPSIKADEKGNASFTFDAPDNLTGWRVLALAVTPGDRLGLGQADFKVNRPTEVRPVMPNQVTERDRFDAGFSVMNRTDKERTLNVTIKAKGLIDTAKTPDTYKSTVKLAPYKRTTVFMPVQTTAVPETRDAAQGSVTFEARAWDDADGDGTVQTVPVNKMRALETAADYGTTTQDKVTTNIAFPDNIYPDVGSVSVVLAPSVVGAVEGAFKYMRDYLYWCWEQRLTKGVMASHYLNLKQYMPDDFKWDGSDKLPQQTLDDAASFQAPNGGMAYFVAQDDYVDPYLSAYTALGFNWLRDAGYKVPETVEKKLHAYLQNMLRNNVMPTFYDEGMTSSVRAVALAALAADGDVTLADLERYRPHVPRMSLFGKANFLQAALHVTGAEAMAKDVAENILSYANETGGKFIFSEELDDSYLRIMASPLRENCAVLDAFTAYGEKSKAGAELVGDVPFKLVRAVTQTRKGRDHWENTQENMFCMKALVDYSKAYETVKPDMTVTASLNADKIGETSFHDLRDRQVTLSHPLTPKDVGTKATVEIDRKGAGRVYYSTRVQYAPKSDFSKPENAGMSLHREYSVERDGKWVLLKNKDAVRRGDLVRVDLYLSLPAARNFVVVNDPVPGGLEPVNRDLANTSKVDADKGDFEAAGGSWFFKFNDWRGYNVSRWSFYHQELRHDRAVFYSDYLPPGNYHLSYAAQAIATGQFTVMPPLAEEMYDPDVYGKDVTGELSVDEAKN